MTFLELKALASKINWKDFIQTFRAEGWKEYPTKRKNIVRIFQKEIDGDFVQASVPIDRNLSDFDRAMLDAARAYADVRKQSLEKTLLELVNPVGDRLSFRVVSQANERTSIPFNDGVALYSGINSLIKSAAQIAVEQTPKGKRQIRLDEFLSACRFSQTEPGSYIVSAILPFPPSSSDGVELAVPPLARLTSIEIMELASECLQLAAENAAEELLAQKASAQGKHGVDFLKSLRSLCKLPDSRISVTGRWSSRSSRFPRQSAFCLSYDSYDVFNSAARLAENCGVGEATTCEGVGKIDKLEAAPNVEERQNGVARVRAMLSGKTASKTVNIMLNLTVEDYKIALKAHESGQIVSFSGSYSSERRFVDCRRLSFLDLETADCR